MSDTSKDIKDMKKHQIKLYRLRLGNLSVPISHLLLQLLDPSTPSSDCPLKLL